jgi:transmembrane sensor
MKENEFESNDVKRIDREAAEWVAKKIGGFTPEQQDNFFEWLAADPRHGEWYSMHQKTWKNLDMLALWMPEHSEKPNQDLLKHKQHRYFWSWVVGIAAAFVFGSVLFLTLGRSSASLDENRQNFVANAYESHQLPDGSVVELNQGAALKVNYSPEFRRVELVSSEAHFNVAKDKTRPFIVSVRGIEIRAVGTAFNVRLTDETVQVIVTEGRVELATQRDESQPLSYDEQLYHEELAVGQMTEVPFVRNTPVNEEILRAKIKQVSLGEMNQLLAWKPQMFEFNSTPLSEVIKEFNSRNQAHLIIGDVELGKLPIVASFRSANVEHFVELLQLSMDLQVEREGQDTIILHSSN